MMLKSDIIIQECLVQYLELLEAVGEAGRLFQVLHGGAAIGLGKVRVLLLEDVLTGIIWNLE